MSKIKIALGVALGMAIAMPMSAMAGHFDHESVIQCHVSAGGMVVVADGQGSSTQEIISNAVATISDGDGVSSTETIITAQKIGGTSNYQVLSQEIGTDFRDVHSNEG